MDGRGKVHAGGGGRVFKLIIASVLLGADYLLVGKQCSFLF